MIYKFLPHTADVKFKAYGKTLEKAFANAALALTEVMIKPEKIKPKIKRTIQVQSEDEKALLYDFLEQFLILIDSEGFLLNSVRSIKIEKNKTLKLKAQVIGDTYKGKYKTGTNIKAVTYAEMKIKKEKDKYIVQVVLDI